MAMNCTGNETVDDYVFTLCFRFLMACSSNDSVPLLVNRIIVNTLALQIMDEKIKLLPRHEDMAISTLPYLRAELLFDFLSKFKLEARCDEKYFKELAQQYIDQRKYSEAAHIISKFDFFDHGFDNNRVVEMLVD